MLIFPLAVLSLVTGYHVHATTSTAASSAWVDPLVHEDFEQAQVAALESSSSLTVSYLINLRTRADLSSINIIQGTLGHDILRAVQTTASESQASLKEWLNAQAQVKRIRPYFVTNGILVESEPDLGILEQLKGRPEVESIESNRPFVVPVLPEQQRKLVQQDLQIANAAAGHELTFQGTDIKTMDMNEDGYGQSTESNEPGQVEWNIEWVNAPSVWNTSGRGEGMIYANADTGVLWRHETLYDNYLGLQKPADVHGQGEIVKHDYAWWDGVRRPVGRGSGPCGVQSAEPCDDNGHGTHTTSTSVGKLGVGVAPGAKWMACRNMDQGLGSTETYLNCLEFFLAPTDLEGKNPKSELRPHAIGNSYGCPRSEGCAVNAFSRAVKTLRAAGIFMSVSAGNDGPGCSTIDAPPAYEELVITVGSTSRQSPQISFFSSRGPTLHRGSANPLRKPDVTAPGSLVRAAFPPGRFTPPERKYSNYNTLSGTSMASPHVGSAALLIMQACPCTLRDIDKVQTLLEQTATHHKTGDLETKAKACGRDSDDAVPNNVYGYGGINIGRAVEQCRSEC